MDNTKVKNIPPWHFGQPLAGETLDWLPTDTKEYFDRAMEIPEHRDYFEKLGWNKPGAITYKINSHGFRCEEIHDGEPYMVALGCSYTVGVGLPIDVIWPTIVGQATNLRVANLAWGGYSADSCFRLAEYWIARLKPKLVTMLTPPSTRVELCLDEEAVKGFRNIPVDVYLPNSNDINGNWFLQHWFANEENHRLNSIKNKLAIQQMCANLKIPCIVLDAEDCMTGSREDLGYARDMLHGGIPAHQRISEKMLNDWHAIQKS